MSDERVPCGEIHCFIGNHDAAHSFLGEDDLYIMNVLIDVYQNMKT